MAIGRLAGSVFANRSAANDAVMRLRANTTKFAIDKASTTTNDVVECERTQLDVLAGGTAAAGLGVRQSVFIRNASGNAAAISRIDHVMATATDAAEDGRIDFYVNVAGTMSRVFRISTTGPVFDQGSVDLSAEASVLSIKDNTDLALTVKEGSNVYMEFDTQNNAEGIVLGPAAAIGTAAFTVALQGRVTTTDGVTSGTARVVGGRAYSNTAASTAHTNTTTEALLDTSYTMPADTLKAGTVVKIRYQGIATSTNGTDTLTIVLRIGGLAGTALLTGTATDVANDNIFAGEFTLICRTAGASGTMVGYGTHTDVPAASGTASHAITEILASTTINTTTSQVIGVTADWSAASASNSCRLDVLVVEIL